LSIVAITLLLAPIALSQSRETGAIHGVITDDQNVPLPGVNVTLSGGNLMGVRTFLTDANGEFRFPALPPGEYQVKAELQGFGTVVREKIRLNTTLTLTVDIQLKPGSISAEVTVIAKSPTVDVKSTETASVTLGNEILRNIPNSQETDQIVNMAPGVTGDVAYGAGDGRGISYQMDGVGVGDPDGGTSWVFLDYNIIEEAKVMGIGLPAEYGNFTGVIFNIVTKSGGNQLSGHFEVDFQGRKTRGASGDEFYLKGDVLPTLWGTENNSVYATDFPEVTSPLAKLLDANVHLGGPIIKDKLWFFAGAQWYHSQDWVTGFPYAQDYKQPRFFLKLTSQVDAKTNMSGAFEYDNYNGTYRGASVNVHPDATVDQIDPEIVFNFNLTHILSAKTFFDFKAAYFNGYYNLEPRTGRDTNAHYFSNDNPDIPGDQAHMRYYSSGYFEEHPRSRFQANASMTHYAENFLQGSHDFKFGVEFEHSRVRNLSSYTGANHYYYNDFWGEGYYGTYHGNYSAYQYEGYNASTRVTRFEAFAQDSWQVTKRLNIGLGVRASQMWGKVKELSGAQYKSFRLAPRVGFTFDLLGDKTTILKGHYGEFTDGMYTSILDRLSPTFSDWTLLYWDPVGENWYPSYSIVHGNWVIDPGIKHPYMRQFTVGVERELFKDTSFSVTYINRSFHNFIGPYNALATYEAVPYSADVYDVANDELVTRDFTLYNLTSGDEAEWHITNLEKIKDLYADVTGESTNPYRKYWGLEFLFNKRFSNRWQMLASYVYSKTRGTITNSTYEDIGWGRATTDPNFWVNAEGYSGSDPRHMIKVQGTYILPLDISFNVYFRGITGGAYTQRFRSGSRDFDQGRLTFNVEPSGTYHYPIAKSLDIRLEKVFTLASKYKLGLMVDVFNVFNDDSITSWGNRIGYDWNPLQWYAPEDVNQYTPSTQGHDLLGLVLPRRARVGIRLIF
jgi:outer membrane receptor protein involved in Fe transport